MPVASTKKTRTSRRDPVRGNHDLPLAVRRHRLVTELDRQLEIAGFWAGANPSGTPIVVVGVSGGPDSLALLLGLMALSTRRDRRERGLRIVAAHVHHHLRESADSDQEHVAGLCRRLDVPLVVKDVRPGVMKGNVAANARRLRYEALGEVAEGRGAQWIATAHQAEDQLETMLMAICRGTGLNGISGMDLVQTLNGSVRLVRPLLHLQKADCQSMCKAAQVQWRDDPSNSDVRRVRARLRRDVTPVLDELWPSVAMRASATAELLRQAAGIVDSRVHRVFGEPEVQSWPRSQLCNEPALVVASGLRRAALAMNPSASDSIGASQLGSAVELIRGNDRRPHQFDWPGALRLEVTARTVRLFQDTDRKRSTHG